MFDDNWATAMYLSLAAGVIIASIVVLTGYAGQLSLAQWAIGGIGALIAARFTKAGVPIEVSILLGILLTIPAGMVFALPALRTRGVNLAGVTLGLGFTVSQVILANPSWIGEPADGGTKIGTVKLFGIDVNAVAHPQRWAMVCLVALVLVGLLVANLRRSRTGRRLIAVRTNERAAASLGVSVFGVKLYAFGVASALAAIAGILVGFTANTVTYARYNPFQSINSVGQAVIGGIGYVLGVVFAAPSAIGGLGTRVIQDWVHLNEGGWDQLLGGVILVVILILHQHGIADLVTTGMPKGQRRVLERLHLVARPVAPRPLPEHAGRPVAPVTLRIEGLTVRFGAVTAVDRARLLGGARRDRRADRPERGGEDHHHRRRHRVRAPGRRVDVAGRRVHRRLVRGPAVEGGAAPIVPVARAVRGHHGRGEHQGRLRRRTARRCPGSPISSVPAPMT